MEKILCAAVKGEHIIFIGKNHAEIIKHAKRKVTQKMQGFITDTGRFVGRKEALKIAQAADQIVKKHGPNDILFSEDLKEI